MFGILQNNVNTFEGILITDGNFNSYAVFIYRCGDINWALNTVIGYRADNSQNSDTFRGNIQMLGCIWIFN